MIMPYIDKLTNVLKEALEKSGKLPKQQYLISKTELKSFLLMSDFLVILAIKNLDVLKRFLHIIARSNLDHETFLLFVQNLNHAYRLD
jgi:hypothetical protein